MVGFVGEHPRLGTAGTFPFMAADFFDAGALGIRATQRLLLNLGRIPSWRKSAKGA